MELRDERGSGVDRVKAMRLGYDSMNEIFSAPHG
jgi:hypothetical protein